MKLPLQSVSLAVFLLTLNFARSADLAPGSMDVHDLVAYQASALRVAHFLEDQPVSFGFSCSTNRQCVQEDGGIWDPPFRNAFGEKRQNLISLKRLVRFAHDEEQRPLFPFRGPHADDGGHRDRRMGHGHSFQIDRADPLSARLDEVLGAIADLHGPLRINGRDIAVGSQPSMSTGSSDL